jgi:hypothetical protein
MFVRRRFDQDAYGLWISSSDENEIKYAKPVSLELEPSKNGWGLPDPTFNIPMADAHFTFKELINSLAMEGLLLERPSRDQKFIDEHLKDLNRIIDQLLMK